MRSHSLPPRLIAGQRAIAPFFEFFRGPIWARRQASPEPCDFAFGNPQDMALPGYVDAVRRATVPRDPGWFAYKESEPAAREAVAASLHQRLGVAVAAEDVLLTKGAAGALAIALHTLVGPGDEVVFVSPPWFFYEAMVIATGATPVRVRCRADVPGADRFDLDVEALAAALTPRTRAVIVNSPNNPTGRAYPEATLRDLARVLEAASERSDRPVYLLSDEAYNRILFEGTRFVSPTACYPWSLLLYSYGKTLLTPGQRLGYLALPPSMPERDTLHAALVHTQLVGLGWPDAVLQYALPELESMSIDLGQLQRRRDRLVGALREQGYDVHRPEGTFYLLPRSPGADDQAFAERLAASDVFVLPGHVVEMPGYFRISLTASDEMVERAVDRFAAAIHAERAGRAT